MNALRGILLMSGAVLCFALLDATSKYLSRTFPVPMLVWARYVLHCLLMVIFLAPSMRWRLVATRRPYLQVFRALMLVGTSWFAMAAIRTLPLAEATSLLFVTPLIVALLAGPLLGEQLGKLHWGAIIVGFAGVLLVARPDGVLDVTGVFLALAATACYSIYQIQTRQLSPSEDITTMIFYTAMVGTLCMTALLPFYWAGPVPDGLQGLMIASLGCYGGFGHFLLTKAFRLAPATILSPVLYTQLIWATLLGWVVFEQLPDGITFVGIAVIAGSSITLAVAHTHGKDRAA